MRKSQQRRRGRSLRSVSPTMADRDADLWSWSSAARSAEAGSGWPARANQPAGTIVSTSSAVSTRAAGAVKPDQPESGGAGDGGSGPLLDVLCGERDFGSVGSILSLRISAAVLPRLSPAGGLARWLLSADQYQR